LTLTELSPGQYNVFIAEHITITFIFITQRQNVQKYSYQIPIDRRIDIEEYWVQNFYR
jgi:hypothetical protein